MAAEIERKFLVKSDEWRSGAMGRRVAQGYLSRDPDRTVRVRIAGPNAFMTVKGRPAGFSRPEIEFAIDMTHARELLEMCLLSVIDKTRYEVRHDGHLWEVDEFHGENEGLVVAEIELASEDTAFTLPAWVGKEVSEDVRYSNSRLSEVPYGAWDSAG